MPIFERTFSQDLDLLEQHLTKDILSQTDCNTTLTKLRIKFENAFNSEFKERMQKYTRFNAQSFQDAMICNMDSIGKYMLEIILHQKWTPQLLKQKKLMHTQGDYSNTVQALNVDSLKVDLVIIQNTFLSKEDLKGTRIEHGFKRAFMSLFGQDDDTFTSTMFLNVDQLQKQLDKDDFQEDGSMAAFWVYFAEYTRIEVKQFRDTLLQHMGNVKKSVAKRTHHQRQYDRRVNKRQMQTQESKIDTGKAVDADLVVTESSGTESEVQDDNSRYNSLQTGQQHTEQPEIINEALKNELRKLKGKNMDTKFAKPSILKKPVLQPLRNQSVVRQPNTFKSERPNFSKPRFASRVDVNNVLSKPVTQHYLPKGRESAFAKPNHMIASSSSRNSSKNMPRFSSNDMVHNHYLEEAQKKTQEKDRNSESSVMHSTRLQNTTNDHKPKPRSNNQTTRSLPVSKSSCVTSKVVPLVDHSRNSSPFSDSKHFVCSTCHKCVFNANHDACITKLLKEVNSRAKIQSHKTRNSTKPVEPTSHTQKPSRQIVTGHRFSPNKSSAVHEKPNTPRSCLRWKPTGRIFKTAGLRWIPTGKIFTSSTTKVDSEPLNGSNEDITNPYECEQTLNVSTVPQGIHKQEQSPNSAQGAKEQQQRAYFDDPCHELLHKAPFLKEKKGVRFSALYLQEKRNLLVFNHSHQQ
ncbi:hypothetical protein Tco_1303332 [Tanacetum coccineum]